MTAERVASAIGRRGRSLTLRRYTGTARKFFDVTVKGVVSNYRPEQLAGGIQQGDRQIIIANTEIAARQWPGPPRRSDAIKIDGIFVTIENVETVYAGEDIAKHVLQVRG